MSHGEMLFLMNEITDIRRIVGGRAVKVDAANYKPAATSIEEDIERLKTEVSTIQNILAEVNKRLDSLQLGNTVAGAEINSLTDTLKNATNNLELQINEIKPT